MSNSSTLPIGRAVGRFGNWFIMWPTASTFGKLEGVFLPSLRQFVSRSPRGMGSPVQMALASGHLYLLDAAGRLWSADSAALAH